MIFKLFCLILISSSILTKYSDEVMDNECENANKKSWGKKKTLNFSDHDSESDQPRKNHHKKAEKNKKKAKEEQAVDEESESDSNTDQIFTSTTSKQQRKAKNSKPTWKTKKNHQSKSDSLSEGESEKNTKKSDKDNYTHHREFSKTKNFKTKHGTGWVSTSGSNTSFKRTKKLDGNGFINIKGLSLNQKDGNASFRGFSFETPKLKEFVIPNWNTSFADRFNMHAPDVANNKPFVHLNLNYSGEGSDDDEESDSEEESSVSKKTKLKAKNLSKKKTKKHKEDLLIGSYK
jgi:hypothetical protein